MSIERLSKYGELDTVLIPDGYDTTSIPALTVDNIGLIVDKVNELVDKINDLTGDE